MKKTMMVLALSLSACGLSEPDTRALSPATDATDELPVLAFTAEEVSSLSAEDDWPTVEPAVCGCQEAACIDAWVRDVVGCDVCVVIACADGAIGGCSLCDSFVPAGETTTSITSKPGA